MEITQQESLYNGGGVTINKRIGGFNPRTLADWLAITGGSQRTAQYGGYGPNALLRKNITTAGDPTIASDFFTNTFGAKVWDSLNSKTITFNLFRKVAWGNTTGWRVRSTRNVSTQGVSETGALPATDSPGLNVVSAHPAFIVTSLGVTALAQFLATLEGGLGDALAVAQETAEVDHLKKINQMLVAPSEIRLSAVASQTSATLVTGGGIYVGIGDRFNVSGITGTITITGIAGDVITFTKATGTGTVAVNQILYTSARSGLWSLSDIVNQTGRTVNGVALTGGAAYGNQGNAADPTGSTNRAAGNWNAAGHINGNGGTIRSITTGYLDDVILQIRTNGFNPDLILTGHEQEVRLGAILQANQHFLDTGTFQVKQGGEATLPGYETGFEVATYKKIPVFTDPDISPVWQLASSGGNAKRGTDAYILDTRYLEIPVLYTTQYNESRDYIHNNQLGVKAIFLTAANVKCTNFRAQGRLTDLSDTVNNV